MTGSAGCGCVWLAPSQLTRIVYYVCGPFCLQAGSFTPGLRPTSSSASLKAGRSSLVASLSTSPRPRCSPRRTQSPIAMGSDALRTPARRGRQRPSLTPLVATGSGASLGSSTSLLRPSSMRYGWFLSVLSLCPHACERLLTPVRACTSMVVILPACRPDRCHSVRRHVPCDSCRRSTS